MSYDKEASGAAPWLNKVVGVGCKSGDDGVCLQALHDKVLGYAESSTARGVSAGAGQ